jgi:hypothetical protein
MSKRKNGAATTATATTPHHPEKKFTPSGAGIGCAVWLNTIETDDGPKQVRTITISPRRYRDRESGEWRDASSYRPSDLPALIFALQQTQEYVYTTPLPDQKTGNGEATANVPF